jgi:hypothetical protein
MKLTGENRSTRIKTCPSVTLSTTNPTWTDPGSNPGLRGERPATNRLSHGTADVTHCDHLLLPNKKLPIPVAARSKAWVCGSSLAGIAGSNLAYGMDVCLL